MADRIHPWEATLPAACIGLRDTIRALRSASAPVNRVAEHLLMADLHEVITWAYAHPDAVLESR